MGVDVHETCSDHGDECPHHHEHHHDSGIPAEEPHEHEHGDDCDHSQSGNPCPTPDCCELSLQAFIGDLPKSLAVPELTTGDLPGDLAVDNSVFFPPLSLAWLNNTRPPPWASPRNIASTRIYQQRFNV